MEKMEQYHLRMCIINLLVYGVSVNACEARNTLSVNCKLKTIVKRIDHLNVENCWDKLPISLAIIINHFNSLIPRLTMTLISVFVYLHKFMSRINKCTTIYSLEFSQTPRFFADSDLLALYIMFSDVFFSWADFEYDICFARCDILHDIEICKKNKVGAKTACQINTPKLISNFIMFV